ncbi:MAG: glycoside hydrolase family 2 TIM barrel-domain containing protein [Propionicimonas sp.]
MVESRGPGLPPCAASRQDGRYPRPQLVRRRWVDLSGPWQFDHGGWDEPVEARLQAGWPARTIQVPFPPESEASGIAEPGYHPVLWYRRTITTAEVEAAGFAPGRKLLLHFGAVDYRAQVWVAGHYVGGHEGGHTPFTVELTRFSEGPLDVVVRVEDDPLDLEQPRGKQDWRPEPHVIWYHRTSGIWQPVWLESVPEQHLVRLRWRSDIAAARVDLDYELAEPPVAGTAIEVSLSLGGQPIAEVRARAGRRRGTVGIPVPQLANGQDLEAICWSPEHPHLLDATVSVTGTESPDTVGSYLGIRSVATGGGAFLLNGRPHPIHAVLSQGYWPQSHLAAPAPEALRAEVALIKELGFTTARLHQKIEDPRLLYWADRLGLMVWAELPSALEFSATSVQRLTQEWTEAIRRDCSHPSIVVWVPMNESWGAQQAALDPAQRHLLQSLYHLAKSLDGSRLVVSNDGWEHADSDLFTIHDYREPAALAAGYADAAAVDRLVAGPGPGGHRLLLLPDTGTRRAPVVLSEFGGISMADPSTGAWGYRVVSSAGQLEQQLRATFGALHASSVLAGWCFTQLTDTGKETNGLTYADRTPKLPAETIRRLIRSTPPD